MRRMAIMFLLCAVMLAGCKKGEAEAEAETTTTVEESESETQKAEKTMKIKFNGLDDGEDEAGSGNDGGSGDGNGDGAESMEGKTASEENGMATISDEAMKAIEESIEQRILESLGVTPTESDAQEASPQVVMWSIGGAETKFPITEAEFRSKHPYARDDGTMFSMHLDNEYVVVYRMMEGMNSWLRVSTVTAEDSAKQERRYVAVLPCGHYLGEKVTTEGIRNEGFVQVEEEEGWYMQENIDAYYLPTELGDQGLVQRIGVYTSETGESYISSIGFNYKE